MGALNPRERRFNRELGAALRRAREALGLQQNDVAQMIGMSSPGLSHIENTGIGLTLRHYCDITAALGLGPVNLLKLTTAIVADAE